MSTSTATSTKNTPDVSPKDFIQLNEYRGFHRQRHNSLSFQNQLSSQISSANQGNNNGQSYQINYNVPTYAVEDKDLDASVGPRSSDCDPFLKRYIRNKKFISFDNAGPRNLYIHDSKKPIRQHNLIIHRKRSKLLTSNGRFSSSSSVNSISPSSFQNLPTVAEPGSLPKQVRDDKHLMSFRLPTSRLSESTVKYLPRNFVDCDSDSLIILISRMMKNLINLNNKNVPESISDSSQKDKNPLLTRYHSRSPPNISLVNYLNRLTKFNNLSSANLLTTIYYIDLLSYNYQPFFTLNSWTVHRFLLVATMISQKSMEDYFFTNEHYAKVGGIAVTELNFLEIDFLTRVNWKCVPFKMENGRSSIKDSKSILDLYYNQLVDLMGSPDSGSDVVYAFEGDAGYEDEDDDNHVEEHSERSVSEQYAARVERVTEDPQQSIDQSKFNSNGYSVDATSSPHLKRRFTNL